MSTIDKTLSERGSRYGDFVGHALITQNIKEALVNTPNWPTLPDDMKEALEMVAHKIGCILNGDPGYIDSWTDIIGYVRLVEKRLISEQAPNEPTQAQAERAQTEHVQAQDEYAACKQEDPDRIRLSLADIIAMAAMGRRHGNT